MQVITQQQFGGPDVLTSVEAPRPTPAAGDVLVRVRAIGLNPVEAYIRSGAFPLLGEPPFTLGWDISGVVEDVGSAVNRFRVGDEVYGMPLFPQAVGGYAELVAAPSRQVVRKPANLDHAHAAAVPLAALTAWQAMIDGAGLAAGERILIHGGAGGVGHLAVQIAKAHGAYVLATASTDKVEFVRSLGADEVIDYRAGDVADTVDAVDVVFDLIGGETAYRSIPLLREGGRLVTALGHGDPDLRPAVEAAGRGYAGVSVEPDRELLERITGLIEAGRLRPHVSETIPFADIVRAHELLDAGHLLGKVVLTVGS